MADVLDPQSKEILKKILAKDLHELSDSDKAFLRARSVYVGKREQEKFASVFKNESRSERKGREQREQSAKETAEKEEKQSQEDLNAHLKPTNPADEDDGPDETQAAG